MSLKMASLLLCVGSMFVSGCAVRPSQGFEESFRDLQAESPDGLAVVDAGPAPSADLRLGSHGMIVTGTPGQIQLSHIPMFHKPHDVQLLLQAKIVGAKALPSTLSDRLYTFLPDLLSLDALRTGKLKEMVGTVYAGNFEDGGTPLERVSVTVTSITHQHVLNAKESLPQPSYFALGKGNDAIVIHRIAGAPGYDQVIHATLTGVSDAQLAVGVELIGAVGADTVATRLRTVQTLNLAPNVQVIVTPLAELSCLVGPQFAAACPKR